MGTNKCADFYVAYVQELLKYKDNRSELLTKLRRMYKENDIKTYSCGADSMGKRIYLDDPRIKDIDPLTVLGFMHSGKHVAKSYAAAAIKEFNLNVDLPTNFDEGPLLDSNQNLCYVWYTEDSQNYEDDINNIWSLFEAAIEYSKAPSAESKDAFIRYYGFVRTIKGIGTKNLTKALYWVAPYSLVPLDGPGQNCIRYNSDKEISKISRKYNVYWSISGQDYLSICSAIKTELEKYNKTIPDFVKSSYTEKIIAPAKGGENVIFYGIPGCGKSYKINSDYDIDNRSDFVERIVFHPDYTYSDFIGQILPKIDENGEAVYAFTPGPFTRVLARALKNPNDDYYLIIEEINRGNAPAIFGDVFQLLDRNRDGEDADKSIYYINNPDISRYLTEILEGEGGIRDDYDIRIPSNLTIIATMNTSDQNVFTLDTAFKRRWRMEYVPDNFSPNSQLANLEIGNTGVKWKQFHDKINEVISEDSTFIASNEDKRLGSYFCTREEISNIELFTNKVLRYLWDDVAKLNRNIFKPDIKTFDFIFNNMNEDNFFDLIFNNIEF